MVSIPKNDYSELGLSLRNPSESLMERFDFDDISNIQGVIVVDVQDDSPAQKAGIVEGDIISRVGRKKIFNTDDFDSEISKYDDKDKILFLVKRGDSSRFLTLNR